METELPHWNGRRWRLILEHSLVGTVRELDLVERGIQLRDECLIVFHEVALAWLRKVAVPGDPDQPYEEHSLGIDLVSNVSRFLDYIDQHDVRFTVRGEIFKTTEKKILQHLIPNPGRELSREEVLLFLFRFARSEGWIDRTGQRTFAVTARGREWSARPLAEKLRSLLEFALEDRRVKGEIAHHRRLRALFLRFLKRVEVGTWYDLMYLPFLVRNAYLASLEAPANDGAALDSNRRISAGLEDPQRLAWNLMAWVRARLYLLGIVDLGYDRSGRPVAMRLSPSGARALGLEPWEQSGASRMGSLVVTGDFEVVLFSSGDDAELVHELDRFCVREERGSVMHFRITEEGVRAALRTGLGLQAIVHLLEVHSRTPLPQNVLFSIHDWAKRAGLMRLGEDLLLSCADGDTLERFLKDPGTRKHVEGLVAPGKIQLKGRATARRMQALLCELGYLVELGESLT
jgi:hypothetical protein